ncbi:MAG TPA: MFS transporter [Candidatus Dormibacteraeota bacterium]|nr:MFS transporter [Candidatus Dormibacteraeota bacterium]
MDRPALASTGPADRLSLQHQVTLSALWLGLNFQSSALLPIVVPAQVLLLVDRGAVASSSQAVAVSAISFGAAIIAIVVTPLAGAASDRMRSRFGRRRQLIVAGVLVALVGQAALAASMPLFLFIAGLVIVAIGSNVVTAAYQGLLPDMVNVSQRGAASGWLGFMTLIGSVGSLAAAGALLGSVSPGPRLAAEVSHGALVFYALAAVVLVLSAAVTVVGIEERTTPSGPAQPWMELLRHQPFRVVFAARALVMIGLTLFLTYIEYYLAATNGATAFVGATVAIALLALFGALASSLALGIASDRIPRVRIVIAANLAMAAAAWIFVFAPAQFPLAPLGILFGLGYGAYLSVDWALAIDSLPGQTSSARDLGIFTVSINLPSLIAPALGGVVIVLANVAGIGSLGYRLVFSLAAISLLLGVVVIRRLRVA